MLVIRREQLDALEAAAELRFVLGTCIRLQQDWPPEMQHMDEARLEEEVRGVVAYCEKLGIETQRGVAQVINVLFALHDGHSLDPAPYPWIWEILSRPEFPEELKISALLERAGQVLGGLED